MGRYACDEDGWRSDYDREVATDYVRDDLRAYYGEALRDIARMIDPETGDGWAEAERAADRLGDRFVDMVECPFTGSEVAAIVVDMMADQWGTL